MFRSKRDQLGKRINGEIWGRGDFVIGDNGKIYPACGGSEVGSAIRKKIAKRQAARARRLQPIESDVHAC